VRTSLFVIAVAVLAAACGTDERTLVPGTWYGGVGAIVRTKCAGCHHEGGIAPFSLVEYSDATAHGYEMLDAVERGIMPPWSTDERSGCAPRYAWKDDARLTPAERVALHAWVDGDMPEGPPQALPPIQSTSLDDATVQVAPAQPFSSTGDRDQFVCFLLDPQLDHAQWLDGSQVFPTAPELVHHANVYLIAPADAAAVTADMGGIGVPKTPCDHPPGIAIQSWLPGNPALLLPDSVGIPVDAGTLVMLQLHYHPAGVGGQDASAVALRFTDTAPKWRYELGVYGNATSAPALQPGDGDPDSGPAFVIPAGASDHSEHMILRHGVLDRELRVMSVTPHMHLLGTHERVTLTHGNGDEECLIDGGWKFDWQRTYAYDAALDELPQFDSLSTVDLTCHWDNSFNNPELPRLLHDTGRVAPYDVWFGLTTADEMCLADFGVIVRQ
jgi:hypothetical protein